MRFDSPSKLREYLDEPGATLRGDCAFWRIAAYPKRANTPVCLGALLPGEDAADTLAAVQGLERKLALGDPEKIAQIYFEG